MKNTLERATKLQTIKEQKAREMAEKMRREQEQKRLLNAAFKVSDF